MYSDPLIQAGLGFAAFVAILAVVRIAIVPDGVGFGDLFGRGSDLEWPRGVQEEEPLRWRPESLTARRGRDGRSTGRGGGILAARRQRG